MIHVRELGTAAEPDDEWVRFTATCNDGTVPGDITVRITQGGIAGLKDAQIDTREFVQTALRARVRDVPEVDQLAALRKMPQPIELVVPETG